MLCRRDDRLIITKLKVRPPVTKAKDKAKTSPQAIAVLILAGLLLPLLAIEAIAYLAPSLIPQEIKSAFQTEQDQPLKGLKPDETLGYLYTPDLVDFQVPFDDDTTPNTYPVSTVSLGYNEAGFRDDGLAGETFAVVIGDSYASCASIEMKACWVELLERETGHDFANLGVVGYSPQQERRMLARYGLPLQPKLVLWVFFPNDLNDAWRFDQFGSGAAREGRFWQNPVTTWLARNSVVYNIGAFFWYNRALFFNLTQTDESNAPRDSNLVWWLTYTDLSIPEVADGFALTQREILAARQETLAQNSATKFVVIIFPYREQVYAPAALQPQLDQLNLALADFCRQQSLTCVDLTPALREKAKQATEPIYYRKDIHLNRRGNEIAAELLTDTLKDHWSDE
jgi:hypothetical protein